MSEKRIKPTPKELLEDRLIDDYIDVHPAIDFFNNNAIISIGSRWLKTYDDGSVNFEEIPWCIMSSGETFKYSKEELARRGLFYKGNLDVPYGRWNHKDIKKFSSNPQSKSIKEIHDSLRDIYEYYIELADDRLYTLFACFTIYTYFFPIFNTAPILHFWGEFQTGKTKLCQLLEAMCFNPINSSNLSGATIFRQVQASRSVILLDESEGLSSQEKNKDIRNMLLAGTGKTGKAYRQEKNTKSDTFSTSTFEVFSPKVIAHIEGIDVPALSSRLIRIPTVYAVKNKEKLNREVEVDNERWAKVRSHLYRLCLTHYNQVILMNQSLESNGFHGRVWQIWKGLFTIASLVSKETLAELESYANTNKDNIESETDLEHDKPLFMAELLLDMIDRHNYEEHYSPDCIMEFVGRKAEIYNKKELGMILGRLGFSSKVHKVEGKSKRLYFIKKDYVENILNRG